MKKIALMAITLLMGLAACSPAPGPSPNDTDWCFKFNFAAQQYDTNIVYGAWQAGYGYTTDSQGRLSFSYVHNQPVTPVTMVIEAQRRGAVTNPVNVLVNFIVFGVGGQYQATIPVGINSVQPQINRTADDDPIGTVANFSLQSSEQIDIRSLTLGGQGANPFGVENCSQETGTPAPGTNTPIPSGTSTPVTPSVTPSRTLTPSRTPSPTNTLVPNWCYTFDFTVSNGGWTSSGWGATYSVAGWSHIDGSFASNPVYYRRAAQIQRSFTSTNITQMIVNFDYTLGTFDNTQGGWWTMMNFNVGSTNIAYRRSDTGGTPTTSPFIWSGNVNATSIDLHMTSSGTKNSTYSGSVRFSSVILRGTGISPLGDNCSPTPTMTATATATSPTSTNTPPTNTVNPTLFTYTPLPLRTRTPTAPPRATNTRVPVVQPPTYTSPPLSTLPGAGTPSGTPTVSGSPTPPQGTIPPGTTTPSTPIGEGGGTPTPNYTPGDTESGVGALGGSIIAGVSNAFTLATGYLTTFGDRIEGVFNAWNEALPANIPGLPNCRTNRLASELCAIYYILTYTVLSGTIGQLIIPAALVVVDLFVVLQFILIGRAILETLGSILRI
jgi:hypothetical protein